MSRLPPFTPEIVAAIIELETAENERLQAEISFTSLAALVRSMIDTNDAMIEYREIKDPALRERIKTILNRNNHNEKMKNTSKKASEKYTKSLQDNAEKAEKRREITDEQRTNQCC